MKKLLILLQSFFITSIAINPIVTGNNEKEQPSVQDMTVSSTDIINLEFNEKEEHSRVLKLPNLANLLNRSDIKDKNIKSASITLTTPMLPELVSHTWNITSWDMEQLQRALRSDVFVNNVEVLVKIISPYINYTEAEYMSNNGPAILSLGTFNWQETGMHLFLTNNVKYEYKIVL